MEKIMYLKGYVQSFKLINLSTFSIDHKHSQSIRGKNVNLFAQNSEKQPLADA